MSIYKQRERERVSECVCVCVCVYFSSQIDPKCIYTYICYQ